MKATKEMLSSFVLAEARYAAREAAFYAHMVKLDLKHEWRHMLLEMLKLRSILAWFPSDKKFILAVARASVQDFKSSHPEWYPSVPKRIIPPLPQISDRKLEISQGETR